MNQAIAQSQPKIILSTIADLIFDEEMLLLVIAIPLLLLPRSYLWQWQHRLTHYDPVADRALAYPGWTAYLGLALIALSWLLRGLRRGYLTVRTSLDLPIALYLLTATLSLWPSVDKAHSLNFLLGIVAGVALYYGLVNWAKRRQRVSGLSRIWFLVALLLAGGTALAFLGFLQTDWSAVAEKAAPFFRPIYGSLAGMPKLWSKTFNVGITASAMTIVIPLGLCLLLSNLRGVYRFLVALSLVSMVGFLVLSQSRGDLLALILTLLVMPAFHSRRWAFALAACCLLLFITIIVLPAFLPFSLPDVLTNIYPSRWEVWTRAFYITLDHPFTGIGLDIFPVVAQNAYPYTNPAHNQTVNAHNRFLQLGVDQGLPGILAFLWLSVAFYSSLWAVRHNPTLQVLKPSLITGLEGSFTGLLISGIFDDSVMTTVRAALVVWALLGVSMALNVIGGKRVVKRKKEGDIPALSPALPYSRPPFSFLNPIAYRIMAMVMASAGIVVVIGFIAHRPVLSTFHSNLANVYREQGWLRNGDEVSIPVGVAYARAALNHYQRALTLNPGNSQAHRDLGVLVYHAHHPEEALRLVTGGPRYGPDDSRLAFFWEVERRSKEGEALEYLQRAAQLAPDDFFARLFLAKADEDRVETR